MAHCRYAKWTLTFISCYSTKHFYTFSAIFVFIKIFLWLSDSADSTKLKKKFQKSILHYCLIKTSQLHLNNYSFTDLNALKCLYNVFWRQVSNVNVHHFSPPGFAWNDLNNGNNYSLSNFFQLISAKHYNTKKHLRNGIKGTISRYRSLWCWYQPLCLVLA